MKNSVYITGINRGIGKEISIQLQEKNFVVHGCARTLQSQICDRVDVNNIDDLSQSMIQAAQKNGKFQYIFLNAGIVKFQKKNTLDISIEKQVFNTNFMSILDAIDIIDRHQLLIEQGVIVLVGSIAEAKGLQGWGAYSASKASLNVIWQSYRQYFRNKGQDLYIYKFGFIKTDMVSDIVFPKPFMIDTKRAVKIMLRHLSKKRAHRIIPFSAQAIYWMSRCMPVSLLNFIQRLLPYEKIYQHQ